MGIGDRIKTVRGSLSRGKFASQTGISKTALVNYESGERTPSSDYLVNILELHLDINPAWLLMGEGDMKRSSREEQPSPIVNNIHFAKLALELAERRFLRSAGWESTCQTPGAVWMWEKEHNGKVFIANTQSAIAMQDALD